MMTINASNAFYLLGEFRNFRTPLEGFVRYDWDLPLPFDIYLHNVMVNSLALANGDIFIMRKEDLHSTGTFEVVLPPRLQVTRPRKQSWCCLVNHETRLRGPSEVLHLRECPYQNQTGGLVTLDYSAVPCERQNSLLQTLSRRVCCDDGLLLFKGPAGTMVPFCNKKPQVSSLTSSALPQHKRRLPKDSFRTPRDPCLVEVAARMTESVHSVTL